MGGKTTCLDVFLFAWSVVSRHADLYVGTSCDVPNTAQQGLIESLNSERVHSDATWGFDMVMDKAAEMQTVNPTLIQ